MSLFAALISLAAATAMSGVDAPQVSAPQQPPSTELEDVEVRGRRLEPQVQSFIDEVAAPPRGRGLARWDRSICVGVANMNGRYAQFMIDRIATAAVSVGLDIKAPGCRPDIMIVAASNGQELATTLVNDNPNGFRPSRSNTDMGQAALDRFKTTDAAVRWWHVSLPVSADTGDVAVHIDGEGPPVVAVRSASRLRSNIRDDLARVMIIIDVSKTGQINFGALSDYVAMVALAQVQADADTREYDSILNLFSAGERPNGMTQWDKDYLASLYTANRDRARPSQQARDIVRGMVGERDTRQQAQDQQP
jgi:hypothetical protein